MEGNSVAVDLIAGESGGGTDHTDRDEDISDVQKIVFNGFAGKDRLTVFVDNLDSGVNLDNVVLEFHGGANDDTLINELTVGMRTVAFGDAGQAGALRSKRHYLPSRISLSDCTRYLAGERLTRGVCRLATIYRVALRALICRRLLRRVLRNYCTRAEHKGKTFPIVRQRVGVQITHAESAATAGRAINI